VIIGGVGETEAAQTVLSRPFDSSMEVALIEPGKAEVWAVGDVFKDLGE
jgi:hypothetical protein